MKLATQIKMFLGALLISGAAHASTGLITCVAPNHQSFTLQLQSEPEQYGDDMVVGLATDLHGMNVGALKALPLRVYTTPILTRTIVGYGLNFELLSTALVQLKDITYASPSFENQIGITGTVQLPNGEMLNLECTQFQVERLSVSAGHACRVPCAHPDCNGYSEELCGH